MKLILYTLFALLTQYGLSDEPIVINLSTESKLLPIALSPLVDDHSGFSPEYVKKLEDVLHFDLNFNGMTTVVKPGNDRVNYTVKARISNKSLTAKLLYANSDAAKQIDGIALTGVLGEDREKIHKLSNAIFKTLFNREGIADSHLLYTVKWKNGSKTLSEVIQIDYDGNNAKVVTQQKALCVSPCYIPARPGFISKNFAYVSYKTGQPKIYFSSLDEEHPIRFSLLKGNQFMPAFSPSCDKIAFICDVTGNPDLFVQNLDADRKPTGKPMQLFMANYGTQATPTFSPDGTKIAFVSNKDGSPRIYLTIIPAAGQKAQATLLTKKNRENTSPCWSPDGKKIAYSSLTKGVRQIWIFDLETRQETQLTDGPSHKENPTFAPNSLHLAFNATEGEQSEIYITNLNTTRAIKITNGRGDKRFPAWEPRK